MNPDTTELTLPWAELILSERGSAKWEKQTNK